LVIVFVQVSSSVDNGFGLLSLAGVVGTGVAGAFYYLERQSKSQAESALEAVSYKWQIVVKVTIGNHVRKASYRVR